MRIKKQNKKQQQQMMNEKEKMIMLNCIANAFIYQENQISFGFGVTHDPSLNDFSYKIQKPHQKIPRLHNSNIIRTNKTPVQPKM